MKTNDVKVCGVTANSAPAGGGGIGGQWNEGTLGVSVDGVSFTPAEYKIYRMLQGIEARLAKIEEDGE